MKTAEYWISHLDMQAHPEGGYFKEAYRSNEVFDGYRLPERFTGPRNFATSIYFLLKRGQVSHLHRIASDETWHFYSGGPIEIHSIHPDGNYESVCLGNNPEHGQVLQYTVPHGCWFGASLLEETDYALVGCTVSPGFSFEDFELAERGNLLKLFPNHAQVIEKLT